MRYWLSIFLHLFFLFCSSFPLCLFTFFLFPHLFPLFSTKMVDLVYQTQPSWTTSLSSFQHFFFVRHPQPLRHFFPYHRNPTLNATCKQSLLGNLDFKSVLMPMSRRFLTVVNANVVKCMSYFTTVIETVVVRF